MGLESPDRRHFVAGVIRAAAGLGLDLGHLNPRAVLQAATSRAATLEISEQAYLQRMASDSCECHLLRRTITGATHAFFDPAGGWEALREHVYTAWSEVPTNASLRVWVPGCGTGEEAYTVAMLVAEMFGHNSELPRRLRVLATDIDDSGLDRARRGRYPVASTVGLPDLWRKRFTAVEQGVAFIDPVLSECVIFAHHDITADPAFEDIDLVVMHGLLDAYVPQMQFRILGAVHDALRPGGVLSLGRDDDLSAIQSIFRRVSPPDSVFVRSGSGLPGAVRKGRPRQMAAYRSQGFGLLRSWLRASQSVGIVVDAQDRVLEVFGDIDASPYLTPAQFDGSLTTPLRQDLQPAARASMAVATSGQGSAATEVTGHPPCVMRATAFSGAGAAMVGLALMGPSGDDLDLRPAGARSVDPGTGLLNRTGFGEQLSAALATAVDEDSRCGILWINIDRFAQINDIHGQRVGDDVLREVADRLREICGDRGFVGRFGGDEFGLVVQRVRGIAELLDVAEALRSQVRIPITSGPANIRLSVSVGAAVSGGKLPTAEALLTAADRAMYLAKADGGDRCAQFSTDVDHLTRERSKLGEDLARALTDGDLVLHYQPIVSLRNSELWGVEALLRWRRDDTVIPASAFIDVALRSGCMPDIGMRVLEALAHDLPGLLRYLPAAAKVCVNMSVPEIQDGRTMNRLLSSLRGIHDRLIVEVTEGALLGAQRDALSSLEALNEHGVGICLDDFGTGYSRLSSLNAVVPSVIKADTSFLDRAVERGAQALPPLRVVPAVSRAIGALSVAEGVSDPARRAIAEECGFDLAQGFHIASPMELAALTRWGVGEQR